VGNLTIDWLASERATYTLTLDLEPKVQSYVRYVRLQPSMSRPIIVALIIIAVARGASVQSQGTGTASAQDLANQANNPAAPLSLIQFRDLLVPHIEGASGVSNGLQVQPVCRSVRSTLSRSCS